MRQKHVATGVSLWYKSDFNREPRQRRQHVATGVSLWYKSDFNREPRMRRQQKIDEETLLMISI